jgi:hypothetical protein
VSVILRRLISIILSSFKYCGTDVKMNNAFILVCGRKHFLYFYFHLFCKGRPEKYVDICPKIRQGTPLLKRRQML